jgi:hypothetical protein
VGKKIFLPMNFLAKEEVSYSLFQNQAALASGAPD